MLLLLTGEICVTSAITAAKPYYPSPEQRTSQLPPLPPITSPSVPSHREKAHPTPHALSLHSLSLPGNQ